MKKTFCLLYAAIFCLLLLTACGETPPPEPEKYQVSWYDNTGAIIATEELEKGTVPQRSFAVSDSAEWDYTFEGWSLSAGGEAIDALPEVSGDVSYYAVVSRVKQVYTVSFDTDGGSSVPSQTVEYGQTVTAPEEPEKAEHRFMGWYSDAAMTTVADFSVSVTGNVTYYAKWNELVNIKTLLSALLSSFDSNPYSYIPEAMRPGYSANLVAAGDVVTDYSSFVNVSDITSHGFGEQWNMISSNLNQTMTFFNVLSAVESVASTSISVFNNYIDSNPGETAHHSFLSGIYNVTIDFDGGILTYVLDYTADIPLLGNQTVQIALSMNIESGEKVTRIQLGDANALTYKVTENSYEFAVKYLGVRRAYFSIQEKNDGTKEGHIYEYLTVSGAEIASAADFYITDDYVSAVGNKAGGMIGFTGYISELYDARSGKMLGYEVREELSSIVYNTLWFDLDEFGCFNSIKYVEANGNNPAKIYINGSSRAWESKTVGGIGSKMFSRRFDIEFRTQYFYSYDAASESYVEIAVSVPMLFVQEENYETLASDVYEKNGLSISRYPRSADVAKLKADYGNLVDEFIKTKGSITVDNILSFIGQKKEFS